MRVLRTEASDRADWTPRLCTHRGQPYAILSHRWAHDPNHEVLFADIEEVDELRLSNGGDEYQSIVRNAQYTGVHPSYKPGFRKVQGAARQALNDGFAFIWIDTCCIDKNSSSELSEAINSMWTWYKSSNVCYVYLADVIDSVNVEFIQSSWWTRGWTLQELLAPQELTFFTAKWDVIGPKKYMDITISEITNINQNVVNGTIALQSVSIAQRMSWISQRTTERIEDMAYCLLGIFDVNMPLLYGEGKNAFLRLQQEIIRNSDDETIFAWRDESTQQDTLSGLLATSPRAFANCSRAVKYQDTDTRSPYSMTNKGLSLAVNLGYVDGRVYAARLHCPHPEKNEEYTGLYLEKISETTEQYARVRCGELASQPRDPETRKLVYVKQQHDQRPAYTAFESSSAAKARLFRILPSEDFTVIRLELVEADIETSRYSILSHMWDRSGDLRTIWVNSEAQKVSKNLFDFLQLMRQSREDKLMWVDFICVRQLDQLETEHVFKIWANISAFAEECIIWLGNLYDKPSQPPRQHPLFLSDSISNSRQISTSSMTVSEFEAKHSLLLHIASLPYWRRSWIIQEISLVHKVWVEFVTDYQRPFTTRRRITLNHLYDLHTSALEDIHTHGLPSIDTLFMSEVLDFVRTRPKPAPSSHTALVKRKTKPPASRIGLESLLTQFQYHEATDPRDRVYALVTFSELWPDFHLDYTLSLAQVVCYVAASLGDRLTLTILPKLITALGIPGFPAKEETIYEHEFKIHHTMYSFNTARVSKVHSETASIVRMLEDKDTHGYLTLQNNFDVPDGLVFVKEQATSARGTQDRYLPGCLYLCRGPTDCLLSDIPVQYEEALSNTSALLQARAGSSCQVLLKTDSKGLLALAFCMQPTSGSLPRIFEDIDEDVQT